MNSSGTAGLSDTTETTLLDQVEDDMVFELNAENIEIKN